MTETTREPVAPTNVKSSAETANTPRFKDGGRVCFLGDSITHRGGFNYHSNVLLYYATRFPQMRFESFNCGISGGSAGGALSRYDWDIAPKAPTVATVMFGMNDVCRDYYGKDKTDPVVLGKRKGALEGYVKHMTRLSERLVEDGARLIYITPSIYDQTGTQETENLFGVNDALGICAQEADRLAAKYNATVVDFHTPMSRLNAGLQARDPDASLVGADRVHPGEPGHLLMGYFFMKSLGVSPVVSSIEINADANTLAAQDNCVVSSLSATQEGVSFTCIAEALPFPVDGAAASVLDLIPFMDDLNREMLCVRGLDSGEYSLFIDGGLVGVYSNKALAEGVNLALVNSTPQYLQALQVREVLRERAEIVSNKIRLFAELRVQFQNAGLPDRTPETINAFLEQKLQEHQASGFLYGINIVKAYQEHIQDEETFEQEAIRLLDAAYAQNTPRAHQYELRRCEV